MYMYVFVFIKAARLDSI